MHIQFNQFNQFKIHYMSQDIYVAEATNTTLDFNLLSPNELKAFFLETFSPKEMEELMEQKITINKDKTIKRYHEVCQELADLHNDAESIKNRIKEAKAELKEVAVNCRKADKDNRNRNSTYTLRWINPNPPAKKVSIKDYQPSVESVAKYLSISNDEVKNLIRKKEIQYDSVKGLIKQTDYLTQRNIRIVDIPL